VTPWALLAFKVWGSYIVPLPKSDPKWFSPKQALYIMLLNKCSGGDLEKLAVTAPNAQNAPTDKQITLLFARLVIGVAYMHQNGYVHGDLKPGNIMICSDGNPRIIDFGETMLKDRVGAKASKGALGGTVGYIPRALTTQGISERPKGWKMEGFGSDIYALGITLWQLYFVGLPKGSATGHSEFNTLAQPAMREVRSWL